MSTTKHAEIYYADWEKTTREDRFNASEGKFIGIDKYVLVDTVPNLVAIHSRTRGVEFSDHEMLDMLFEKYNIGEGAKKLGIRSMSVGDIVVFEKKTAYLCSRVGWTELDLTKKDIHDMG